MQTVLALDMDYLLALHRPHTYVSGLEWIGIKYILESHMTGAFQDFIFTLEQQDPKNEISVFHTWRLFQHEEFF